ncbi:hypothetical protein ABIE78_006355 [Sinorhizobium fredii]|uniref:Uncharacterized protein n=1 Tax=Sinorhizobium fredii (strain USDA 257) TaxID=1185652 RepID=I3XDR0_SINF2|nr:MULTISPECIES: hypothetical protein [Sinorhizobium]AFL54016.1 hypothetical protein USDA257_c55010 [Sinorhizobium fredii USDA 257]PDT80029.1 hypothetical protein CO676_29730 [Sinorhizobium sp. BJ1]
MQEELKIYRLSPLAGPSDPNWQNAKYQGEVVVVARSSGDARIVASEAELDFREIDAKPAEGVTTDMASAFRSEKLYTVIEEGPAPPGSNRGVIAGQVTVDNIISTEL